MILKLGVLLMLLKHFNCAEWINITDVSEVEKNGIIAGTNGGQKVYIGKAFADNGSPEPGALYLRSGPGGVPVVIYGHGGLAYHETVGIQYLKKDSHCRYVWVPSKNGMQMKKTIEVLQGTTMLYIGRLKIYGEMQVGKVGVLPHKSNYFYYGHGDVEYSSPVYEVLTCR